MFTESDLFLPAAGRLPWKKRGPKPPNVCKPQLRLFTTELAFLTLALSRIDIKNCVVVYAGAARGNHIPALASLYPTLPFYLYDSHDFAISSTPQITIFRTFFTDRLAEEWRLTGRTILFISDIRTMDKSDKEYETQIGVDMTTQARWVEIMKPAWWSLKFRIPYPIVTKAENYLYLPGWLMFQPFAKNLSMEMRLIGQKTDAEAGMKSHPYDTRDLEQQLYYHNTQVRPDKNRYLNIYSLDEKAYDDPAFDRGYDMTYLLYVIDNYRRSSHAVSLRYSMSEDDNLKLVENMMAWIGC